MSFAPDQLAQENVIYNYRPVKNSMTERPGISVFYEDPAGTIFHPYSCYVRGLDTLDVAYHYLDLTPKRRDEEGLPFPCSSRRFLGGTVNGGGGFHDTCHEQAIRLASTGWRAVREGA